MEGAVRNSPETEQKKPRLIEKAKEGSLAFTPPELLGMQLGDQIHVKSGSNLYGVPTHENFGNRTNVATKSHLPKGQYEVIGFEPTMLDTQGLVRVIYRDKNDEIRVTSVSGDELTRLIRGTKHYVFVNPPGEFTG